MSRHLRLFHNSYGRALQFVQAIEIEKNESPFKDHNSYGRPLFTNCLGPFFFWVYSYSHARLPSRPPPGIEPRV